MKFLCVLNCKLNRCFRNKSTEAPYHMRVVKWTRKFIVIQRVTKESLPIRFDQIQRKVLVNKATIQFLTTLLFETVTSATRPESDIEFTLNANPT